MTYDLNDLRLIVQKKRSSFLTSLFTLIFLAILCVLLITFVDVGEVIILSGAALFVIFLLLFKLFDSYNPKILFSKEIRGENVKESEYEIMKRGSASAKGIRYRQVGSTSIGTRSGAAPIAPNTRANRKAFHKNMHFNGEVYIKSENGDINLLTGLYGSHLEIYEEGDILLKPEGCKFLIITSRDTDRQPCPVCGEVNGEESERCFGCGLKILGKGDPDEHKI